MSLDDRMGHRLLRAGGYTAVLILVLTAVLNSVTRLPTSWYQAYLPAFQENISSVIGKPVHMESVHLNWYGFTPLLTVEGLAVYADDTKSTRLLAAEKALISLNLPATLMQGKPVFKELQLMGSSLVAVRDKDQRIVLNGIDFSERIASRKEGDMAQDIRFSLLASSIAIKDEILERDYHFDRVDIVLGFHEARLRVSSRISLPDTLGNSLWLGADLEGLDQGLNHARGTVYTKGENINLELLGEFFPQLELGVQSGRSDFEAWGELESRHSATFEGRLAVHDLEYQPLSHRVIEDGQEITAIDTRFRLQKSREAWHLALIESDIRSGDQRWAGEQYEIRCIGCEADREESTIAVALQYFNTADLLATLQHFPEFSEHLQSFSPQARLAGEFTDTWVQLELHGAHVAKYAYRTSLHGVTVSVPSHELEISRLTGEATGDHLHGMFVVNSPALKIRAQQLNTQAFPDQAISGRLTWYVDGQDIQVAMENISIQAEGLQAKLQGVVHMQKGRPHVDLQAHFPEVQIAALQAWLPLEKLDLPLAQWLSASEGSLNDIRVLLMGDPGEVPFRNPPGRLEVYAKIEATSLGPYAKWPGIHDLAAQVEIYNQHLHVHGDQGQILDASVLGFDIAVEDVLLPRVEVEGTIRGSASDFLDALAQSPMAPNNAQMPAGDAIQGMVDLNVNLVLPLADELDEPAHIGGMIEFSDASLSLGLDSLPLTHLNGQLKFSNAGLEGEGLSAQLYGSPFEIGAAVLEQGGTRVQIQGELDLDAWLAASDPQTGRLVQGKAPMSVTIDLPPLGDEAKGEEPLEIRIESDLAQASLALPEPFGKEAGAPSTLSIHSRFHIGRDNTLVFNYKDRIFAKGRLDADEGELTALEIRIGDDQFDLPSGGIKVSGRFDRLDIDQWLDLYEPGDAEGSMELQQVDIHASELSMSELTITDIDLRMQKQARSWVGEVHSHTIKGTFEHPLELDAESIVITRLEHLRMDYPEEDHPLAVNPREYPALDFHIGQLELNGYAMSNVTLKTQPSAHGMIIDSMVVEEDSYRLETSGTWDMGPGGAHTTEIATTLTARDLHDALASFGLDAGVNKGKGVVSANLRWPDMPDMFSLDAFEGTATLRFKDGEITDVDPGAGRLVGLINLAEITRRLTLDFSDFFSEGYVFDKIRGTLVFKDGNLTTEDLRIDGPSADMEISGRTGIVTRDYDQFITVTPNVTGGLPWLGIGLGPVGVGGIYILGKIGEKVGIDVDKVVDKVVEVKYHMTGSWENPEIEPVERKIADLVPSLPLSE